MDWVSFAAYAAPFAVLIGAVVFCTFQVAQAAIALRELAGIARRAVEAMGADDRDDDVVEQVVMCQCGERFEMFSDWSAHQAATGHMNYSLVDVPETEERFGTSEFEVDRVIDRIAKDQRFPDGFFGFGTVDGEALAHTAVLDEAIRMAMDGKCYACGWPISPTKDQGCSVFNCSFRPGEHTPEYPSWHLRAARLDKAMTWLRAVGSDEGGVIPPADPRARGRTPTPDQEARQNIDRATRAAEQGIPFPG